MVNKPPKIMVVGGQLLHKPSYAMTLARHWLDWWAGCAGSSVSSNAVERKDFRIWWVCVWWIHQMCGVSCGVSNLLDQRGQVFATCPSRCLNRDCTMKCAVKIDFQRVMACTLDKWPFHPNLGHLGANRCEKWAEKSQQVLQGFHAWFRLISHSEFRVKLTNLWFGGLSL